MLRFTLAQDDIAPGNLTISADHVMSVCEHETEKYRLATIHMCGGSVWCVLDPKRDAAQRIAEARGGYGDLSRC